MLKFLKENVEDMAVFHGKLNNNQEIAEAVLEVQKRHRERSLAEAPKRRVSTKKIVLKIDGYIYAVSTLRDDVGRNRMLTFLKENVEDMSALGELRTNTQLAYAVRRVQNLHRAQKAQQPQKEDEVSNTVELPRTQKKSPPQEIHKAPLIHQNSQPRSKYELANLRWSEHAEPHLYIPEPPPYDYQDLQDDHPERENIAQTGDSIGPSDTQSDSIAPTSTSFSQATAPTSVWTPHAMLAVNPRISGLHAGYNEPTLTRLRRHIDLFVACEKLFADPERNASLREATEVIPMHIRSIISNIVWHEMAIEALVDTEANRSEYLRGRSDLVKALEDCIRREREVNLNAEVSRLVSQLFPYDEDLPSSI